MKPRAKQVIYSIILLVVFLLIYQHRNTQNTNTDQPQAPDWIELRGHAQGTTYQIKYYDSLGRNFQTAIDSLLKLFDQALSLYLPTSEISQFNQNHTDSLCYRLPYFYPVLKKSYEVYTITQGAFDPTVAPLVRAYGFSTDHAPQPPSPKILDSLRQLVGFQYIDFDSRCVRKRKPFVQLDFNAIAQGYSVDVIAEFLASRGIQNYMVEIGGEVRCAGKNPDATGWRIGIKDPIKAETNQPTLSAIIELNDQALATSGNYEKFYIKDGKKFTHTIDPRHGLPVEHSLLSATVIAPDAMTADAYATAFMVVGLEKALSLLEQLPELKVYFIYDDAGQLKSYSSPAIEQKIQRINHPPKS